MREDDKPLYERTNYLINAKFIHNVSIREYDIKQANISILFSYGRINSQEFDKLSILPKQDREIYVGNMIRMDQYNQIYPVIKQGITQSKKKLFELNNIQDYEVVRIASDAVYVMRNGPLAYTKIKDKIEFIEKHRWTSFLRVGSITILFSNLFGNLEIDVIGIAQDRMQLHQEYMLNFIANLLYRVDTCQPKEVMDYFNDFYMDYICKQLDIGYYRDLTAISMYTILGSGYRVDTCDDLNVIDISWNALIMREIYGILADMYTR